MKMRHELSEYLSLSSELKLYVMKCAPFCDAHLEQHQVADDFYTETDIRALSAFEAHGGDVQARFQIPPKLLNTMVLFPNPKGLTGA